MASKNAPPSKKARPQAGSEPNAAASTFGSIVGAAGAAGLFLGAWFLLAVPLPFSLVAGAVGYVALYFVGKEIGERLFPGETPLDTAFVDTELAESTAAYADERLAALRDALRRFRATDPRARKFQRVAELMAAIARDVRSDPKDAPAARTFLAYYADASVRLANLVADMDERGASAEQLADANARLGTALDRLVAAFEHHLARLQDDNLAELQAELDVLEQSMGFDDGSIFASLESLGERGEKGKPATGAK